MRRRERVAEDRRAQGLPEHVQAAAALDHLSTIAASNDAITSSAHRQRARRRAS